MNIELPEMRYFDCTCVWGISYRNGSSNFEYLCNFASFLIFLKFPVYFNVFLGPLGGAT